MASSFKVLGQIAPAANTNTDLYTAPAGSQVVVSTLYVCNRGASSATFRIAIRPSGEALADKHYAAYDMTVDANATIPWTIGWTLNATDVITVRASNANLSFAAFGTEITP